MVASSTKSVTEIGLPRTYFKLHQNRRLQGGSFGTLNTLNVPLLQDGDNVNLVWTGASLLSINETSSLKSCTSAQDPACTAGIATVAAYVRKYVGKKPVAIIPLLDFQSAFVQIHPDGWNINRLVFQKLLNTTRYFAKSWIFNETKPNRDWLRSHEMGPLISNAVPVGTDNLWFPYIDYVHFDIQTSLAIFAIDQANQTGIANDSATAVSGLLQYVAAENNVTGCNGALTPYEAYLKAKSITHDSSNKSGRCWIPVIVYQDQSGKVALLDFVNRVAAQKYPPAVIIDMRGNNNDWAQPLRLNNGIWVASYLLTSNTYFQQRITVNGKGGVSALHLIKADMTVICSSVRFNDSQFATDITFMHSMAAEAAQNDLVVGRTGFMPFIRTDDDMQWRRCMGGECPGGNLFTDAFRWYGGTDIAFTGSGRIRGRGWPAGEVRLSDIFNMLPFPNTGCKGVMAGMSIFRLLDYSTRLATFESTFTPTGDRLLQVSGMRYTYNTKLPATETTSRLISIEIWDGKNQTYQPVDRLKLYSFTTNSWLCSGFDPYPSLLGSELVVKGEVAGVIDNVANQDVVADYLRMLGKQGIVYNTSIQGRLVNDTTATVPMDLLQTPADCKDGEQWDVTLLSCTECPKSSKVYFVQKTVEFNAVSGSMDFVSGQIEMINEEKYEVAVQLKSNPLWINFTGMPDSGSPTIEYLQPGDVKWWNLSASAATLAAGTASASVAFSVQSEGSNGCSGNDAIFDVMVRVAPVPTLSKPGSIIAFGLTLMSIIAFLSVFLGLWVVYHKKSRIVKAMQPQFLVTICFGVFVIAMSIIPFSFQDYIVRPRGRDMACMATPWLVSLGFSIAILSLYAKLWRINQVFHAQQFRHLTVTSHRVLAFCGVMAAINFSLLLLWTLIDPLEWVVRHVADEPWKQYGACEANGAAGVTLFCLVAIFNGATLVITCHQAYKAKDISDEYSEAKHLGIALFGWVEIVLVGFPVLFLIQSDNSKARYFLQAILIACICLSMLLIIFVPIMMHFRAHQTRTASMLGTKSRVTVTGIGTSGMTSASPYNSSIAFEAQRGAASSGSINAFSSGMEYASSPDIENVLSPEIENASSPEIENASSPEIENALSPLVENSSDGFHPDDLVTVPMRQLDAVEEEQSVDAHSV